MFNLFGHKRRRSPQSYLWSVRPNGTAFRWKFESGHWWWEHGHGSFPQGAAIQNAKEHGYEVVRLPVGQRP